MPRRPTTVEADRLEAIWDQVRRRVECMPQRCAFRVECSNHVSPRLPAGKFVVLTEGVLKSANDDQLHAAVVHALSLRGRYGVLVGLLGLFCAPPLGVWLHRRRCLRADRVVAELGCGQWLASLLHEYMHREEARALRAGRLARLIGLAALQPSARDRLVALGADALGAGGWLPRRGRRSSGGHPR